MPLAQAISADPLKAQGFRTQRAELPEDLWQPLYDRVNYPAAGTTQLSFFSTPMGQSANLITGVSAAAPKVKDYRDTNMQNANVVPTKLFKFVGISIAFINQVPGDANNAADRDRVRNNAYFKFRIVDKDILYVPLVAIPEVNPITVASTTATDTTIIGCAGGGGQNVPMYRLPIPITLNPYENFSVDIVLSAAVPLTSTNSMDIYTILQGFMRRPT
ncbi:MAG: hypothetical protein K6T87_16185 [Roseiflexus sp.]|uniref:hypothetical protein n=1 Tax=Roseiflexus sp. TaxID=2562120 RepID=UPI0025E370FD|nr:hypothetical protein [Roseiflexus sp.]MCL6542096.1 hypothetical protein [Roseiflexus sp.]